MEASPQQHNLNPDQQRNHRILLGIGFLVGFLWPLYRLLTSNGWILDDELSHFLHSKSVVHWSEMLLDEWARPGRNLIHSIMAPFGLTATRIYTLVISTVAVFICYRIAVGLKIRHAWSIPFLLCFQPWYPELSYPVLTQAPFMLVWILAVYLALKDRMHLAGFTFGYLSLIRHEGIFITALWGLWVICQPGGIIYEFFDRKGDTALSETRKPLAHSLAYSLRLGGSTILPILILNVIAYVIQGRIPFAVYFDSNPTDIYGNGSLFHYVPKLLSSVGGVMLTLSCVALYFIYRKRAKKWSLILLTYPAYFALHSVIFWKGSFASGGYYHFLMPMAPMFALLAALSISEFLEIFRPKIARIAVAIIIITVCYQGLHMGHYQHIHQDWKNIMAGKASYQESFFAPSATSSPSIKQIEEASQLAELESGSNNDTIIHCAHVYFYYLTDQPDTQSFRNERLAPLSTFAVGSHYIWESKYADLEARTSLAEFTKNPNWQVVRTWLNDGGDANVVLFRKVNNSVYDENLTPKGRNLSY